MIHQIRLLLEIETQQIVIGEIDSHDEIFEFGHVQVETVRVRGVVVQIDVVVRSDTHEIGNRVVIRKLKVIRVLELRLRIRLAQENERECGRELICENADQSDGLTHDEGAGKEEVDYLEVLI